jgi:hypothetical protein
MIKVMIHEDTALEMLMDRLSYWTEDETTHELYKQMYESYLDCGVFESCEFDVMVIVDNDYINYCDVVEPDDDSYEEIKALYEENGCGDISCEFSGSWNFIEAEYNGYFLVRY